MEEGSGAEQQRLVLPKLTQPDVGAVVRRENPVKCASNPTPSIAIALSNIVIWLCPSLTS